MQVLIHSVSFTDTSRDDGCLPASNNCHICVL